MKERIIKQFINDQSLHPQVHCRRPRNGDANPYENPILDTLFLYELDKTAAVKNMEKPEILNANIGKTLHARGVFAYVAAYLDTFIQEDESGAQEKYPCIVMVYEDQLMTKIQYIGYDIIDADRVGIYEIGEDMNSTYVQGLFTNMLREKVVQN